MKKNQPAALKSKLFVGLLCSNTSNNMTRLYCAMKAYRSKDLETEQQAVQSSEKENTPIEGLV